MSQLVWVQILYDQQLTSIGYFLSAKIAIKTQQFFCPPKPRVVGSIPASRTKNTYQLSCSLESGADELLCQT
jgi:hypothetical protein